MSFFLSESNNSDSQQSSSLSNVDDNSINMDLNNNDDNKNNINDQFNNFRSSQDIFDYSSQESSPFYGSQESSPFYGSPNRSPIYDDVSLSSSSQLSQKNNYHQNNQQNDERTQTRRIKNRESAARSRQKIKNLLQKLEMEQKQLYNNKIAIENVQKVYQEEIDHLNSLWMDMKIEEFFNTTTMNKNGINRQQLQTTNTNTNTNINNQIINDESKK